MDWYPWNIKLFKADTMHLDPYQDGCYRRLIDHYMETRQPLPDNDAALARIVGDSLENWKNKAADSVRPFFTKSRDGTLRQKRCDIELSRQDKQTKRKSEAGSKGAEKRWKIDNEIKSLDSSAIAGAPKSHSIGEERRRKESLPTDTSQVKRKNLPTDTSVTRGEDFRKMEFPVYGGIILSFDQLFERFWNNYPKIRDRGHKGRAKNEFLALLVSGVPHFEIGKGITRFKEYCDATGEKNPDFSRWLKNKFFEREFIIPTQSKTKEGKTNVSGRPLSRSDKADLAVQRALDDLELEHEAGQE